MSPRAEFLHPAELCTRLSISRRRLTALVRGGLLPPPVVMGKLERFYWPEVHRAMLQHRKATLMAHAVTAAAAAHPDDERARIMAATRAATGG